jgi:hypothetical protein
MILNACQAYKPSGVESTTTLRIAYLLQKFLFIFKAKDVYAVLP